MLSEDRPALYAPLAATARHCAVAAGRRLMAWSAAPIEQGMDPMRPRWKEDPESGVRSVVSAFDERLEHELRIRLQREWPDHGVIGEEFDDGRDDEAAFVWVIDPIDGTSNFIHRVPLFAVSIGVVHEGRAVAGAVWCASTHRMGPGVYHASLGSALHLDDDVVEPVGPRTWRGVVAEPAMPAQLYDVGDPRVLACAALECAWSAAGILRGTLLSRPRIWDVAAGVVLAQASGCRIWCRAHADDPWRPFTSFGTPAGRLRAWSRSLLVTSEGTEFALRHETEG